MASQIVFKTGDLFTTDVKVLGHGVNCCGVMGAGIAKSFAEKFPRMVGLYENICMDKILNPGGIYIYEEGETTVYNMATQDFPGANADLGWVATSFMYTLLEMRVREQYQIAIPRIGSGIGGLEWSDVQYELELQLANYDQDKNSPPIQVEVWTLGD